jgi:hypothetical protein
MKPGLPLRFWGVGLLAFVFAHPVWATVADDLCAPIDDPCVLSTVVNVDPSSTLDFGSRTFRIADNAKLIWRTDLTINAGACEFAAKSQVIEHKDSPGTGFLELNCNSTNLLGKITTVGSGVLAEGDGPHVWGGVISAKGPSVNVIAIDSYGSPGDITLSGKIKAVAKTGTPPGEFRFVSNFGNIEVAETAKIALMGAESDPFTELVWFEAGTGKLDIKGAIQAKTKVGAYEMTFEANGPVTLGAKAKISGKGNGTGAKIGFNSQSSSVTFFGKVMAPAKNVGPNGPKIRICAADDVIVAEKSLLDASDKGSGGSIIIGAGDLARVRAGSKVYAKTDGDIEVCGGSSGLVSSSAKVVPAPEAVGQTGACLSPNSQFIFFLDCNQ